MSDWWHVAQASAPALGSLVVCIGLRRYLRTMLWNVLLKVLAVDADERRAIALEAARLDLAIERKARRGRRV